MINRLLFLAALAGLGSCIGTDLVDDPPPMLDPRIEVRPGNAEAQQGDTQQFEATYYDTAGEPVSGVVLSWASSNIAVASIDAEGLAEALEPGQVMITAAASDAVSQPVFFTVVADPMQVARVMVEPDTARLQPGESVTFTATAFNLGGDLLDDKTFTWNLSDPTVADLGAEGQATAKAAGTTDVTATTDGIASAPARLIVMSTSRQGAFASRGSYTVRGTALLEQATVGLVLRFGSDFQSSAGPRLGVYLSGTDRVNAGSVFLGELQATSGAQTYAVPPEVAMDTFDYVIIHCIPFNVQFGFAQLD